MTMASASTLFSESQINLLSSAGQQQLQQGQFSEALRSFQKLLSIAEQGNLRCLKVEGLIQIGSIHYYLGHYAWSIRCFEQALKQVQDLSIKQGPQRTKQLNKRAEIYAWIGQAYYTSHQYSKALKSYTQALDILKTTAHPIGMGSVLNRLGEIHIAMNQFELAREYCLQALDITSAQRTDSQTQCQVSTLYHLGIAEYHLGRSHQALAHLLEALSIKKKLCQRCQILQHRQNQAFEQNCLQSANIFKQLGSVYLSLKQAKKALGAYQRAGQIYQMQKQQQDYAELLNYVGVACYKQGNISQALWYHMEALQQTQQPESDDENSERLPHVLKVYQEFQALNDGVKLYRRAQQLASSAVSEMG
ncbi:MAG: tetratricopeptide repeat protein [Microcoleaceae cyanobacterium]